MKLRNGRKPVHMRREVDKVIRDENWKRVKEILSCRHEWLHRLASGGRVNESSERFCFQCVKPCGVEGCIIANQHDHNDAKFRKAFGLP